MRLRDAGFERFTSRRRRLTARRHPALETLEGRRLLSHAVAEFPLPTAGGWATFLAAGRDGNVWVAEAPHVLIGVDYIVPPDRSGPIAKVAPDGTVTEFPLPPHVIPGPLAAGPDGAVWFAETLQEGAKLIPLGIDRITTDGAVSPVPGTAAIGAIGAMATGPDGSVWVAAHGAISRVAAGGAITGFAAAGADGQALAVAADGTAWFTESTGTSGALGRLTPSTGAVASFPMPSAGVTPQSVAVGVDGTAWFTESVVGSAGVSRIGRVSPAGVVAEFPLDVPNSFATGISAGPDGALYFVENSPGTPPGYADPVNAIGRIAADGTVTDTPLAGFNGIEGVTAIGPDGNLWFGGFNVNKVGRYALDGPARAMPHVVGVGVAPPAARGSGERVALTFDSPLAPSRAADPGNYALVEVIATGRRGQHRERHVRLASASYNDATRTVTLAVRGTLHAGHAYQVLVNATPPPGLAGANGVPLAGDATGHLALPFSPPRPRRPRAR